MTRLKLVIDYRTGLPIFEQLVAQLEMQILSKRLKTGARLPTVRMLAEDLGVHFNTVARVYRELDRKGLITVQHGRGTYVLAMKSTEERGLTADVLSQLANQYVAQAQKLGIPLEKARHAVTLAYRQAVEGHENVSRETKILETKGEKSRKAEV